MQTQTTTLIYSVFSGIFYEVLTKDVELLNIGQIPLKKYPNTSCKKCYGRGHIGRDNQTYAYNICNCVRKNIDFDIIKKFDSNK
jgi:hypothetical protein